ncbi:MAG TPA: cell division protein ZapA [candidate division Zixibacteria bacterium]|nr:cell division protein ZapA [candidate division Zixibacteria bacterium]
MADAEKTTVSVKIYNQELKIRTDEPPEYVRDVARYVDSKIYEVVDNVPGISSTKALILAAMNIADELFKQREEHQKLVRQLRERSEQLAQKLSEITSEIDT